MDSRLKKKALTKLLVYWKIEVNGRRSQVFYSVDKPRDIAAGNADPGIKRLHEKIILPYKGRYENAILYQNKEDNSGPEVGRYDEDGNLI